MASALCRTTSRRLRLLQLYLRIRVSSYHLTPSSPSPDALVHGDFFPLARSFSHLNNGIERLQMDQRSFLSTSATDANSDKSGGSGNSEGGSDQKTDRKDVRGAPVSWMSFFLLFATGAGLVYYYDREKKLHIEDINTKSRAVKEGPSAGKAGIGGSFNLIRDHGKRVTEKDLMGKWTILYFGFTHCPDICPVELIKLAAAIDKRNVVPVFVSVDPERDTVQQVLEHMKEFHPKLVGLVNGRA